MSDLEYCLEGLKLTVLLSAIVLAYHYVLKPAILDNWKQSVFDARNTLWDYMHEYGRLDSPAHRAIRERFNALLRFGPRLDIILIWMLPSPEKSQPKADLDVLIEAESNPEVRLVLRRADKIIYLAIARRVLTHSLLGVLYSVYQQIVTRMKVIIVPLSLRKDPPPMPEWEKHITLEAEVKVEAADRYCESAVC